MKLSRFKAVIFDMDGLLVDSEPWWRVAETHVFGQLSVAPTEKDFEEMMGNRIQEVIERWHNKHPWPDFNPDRTMDLIIEEVGRLVTENATLLPGVKDLLTHLSTKNTTVLLASSSPLKLIKKLIGHYHISEFFHSVHSAEFEQRGKPHPDVFLTAARSMSVSPADCLVFEDSYNGVMAAKNAGMTCIAVPAPEHRTQERFQIADEIWHSLEEFKLKLS